MNENQFLKKWVRLWAIAVGIFIALTIAGFFLWEDKQVFFIPVYIIISVLSFWLIHFWYNRFDATGIEAEKKKNPYRKMFFSAVNAVSILLLLVGFWGAFVIIASDDGNVYNAMALIITIIWAVIFLRYFVWAIYYYNINYGLTDKDWEKIFEAREMKAAGLTIPEGATEAPEHNPFRSQTFGLPPGTVRGMIAFTLLFGAVALTIASMGMPGQIDENSFFWDHFEFFKTAFLMMIAFYFGDRSLKYLSKRWPQRRPPQEDREKPGRDDIQAENEDLVEEDRAFAKDSGQLPETPAKVSPTSIKKLLQEDRDEAKIDEFAEAYKQIKDNEAKKLITDEDLENVIEQVKANNGLTVQLLVLKAIIQIESAGSGFLPDGRAKILFEGHIFWRWLKKFGVDREKHMQGNENILYPTWTQKHYKGGIGEYERFEKAKKIHEQAAVYAASWGKFQVLGENLEHNIKERIYRHSKDPNKKNFKDYYYEDWRDFSEKQQRSEFYHLLDFIAFIKTKTVKGTPLIEFIAGTDESKYDWAKFAYGYNGSGYQKNNYDVKLQKAYENFKNV